MSHAEATRQAIAWITSHDPFTIDTWTDPVVAEVGHAALGHYTEAYWLPIVGPTALLMLRRFATLRAAGIDATIRLEELGREMGLGGSTADHAPVVRSLSRLITWRLARPAGDRLEVRTVVPPLTRAQVARLPFRLAQAHDRHLERARLAGYQPALRTQEEVSAP